MYDSQPLMAVLYSAITRRIPVPVLDPPSPAPALVVRQLVPATHDIHPAGAVAHQPLLVLAAFGLGLAVLGVLEEGRVRVLWHRAAGVRPPVSVWRDNKREEQRPLGVSPRSDVEKVFEVAPLSEVEGV